MNRISVKKYRKDEGYESEEAWTEHVNNLVMDSVCPALCEDGCEVEPEGECQHGHPSLLIAMGLI